MQSSFQSPLSHRSTPLLSPQFLQLSFSVPTPFATLTSFISYQVSSLFQPVLQNLASLILYTAQLKTVPQIAFAPEPLQNGSNEHFQLLPSTT